MCVLSKSGWFLNGVSLTNAQVRLFLIGGLNSGMLPKSVLAVPVFVKR